MAAAMLVIFGHLRSSINGLKNKRQSLGKAEVKILPVFDVRDAHHFEEQIKT